MKDSEGEDKINAKTETPGLTLLPAPIASVVSLVTRSSSLYLRLGTFIGGLAIDGARVTTLTGLELSRAVTESILYRAGKDVSARTTGELGKAEAESLLERSIATLHSTITNISFAASTGFYISTAALESATDVSQQLLGTLDSILGSTDSSRAIASIITLIRREFQNPATGQEGEKVSIADLLMGICGLVLLQRWCKKFTDAESKERKYEEVVWDVVVLDNGRRADVVGPSSESGLVRAGDLRNSMSFMTTGGSEVLETIEREGERDSEEDLPEIRLKQRIMRSLPPDASISITTSTTTTKTITVEITGTHHPDLSPPPGVEIIEQTARTGDADLDPAVVTNDQEMEIFEPKYRVVYRIIQNKSPESSVRGVVEDTKDITDLDTESNNLSDFETPVSPSFQGTLDAPKVPAKDDIFSHDNMSQTPCRPSSEKKTSPSSIPVFKELAANQKRARQPKNDKILMSGSESNTLRKLSRGKAPVTKKVKSAADKPIEKKGSFRTALKKGSGTTLSNLWNKDPTSPEAPHSKLPQRPSWGTSHSSPKSNIPVPPRDSSIIAARDVPSSPQRGNPNYFSSRDLGAATDKLPQTPSRTSYISAVHEQRRASVISQTDTYSVHSAEGRPASPTAFRTHLRAQSNLIRAVSEKSIASQPPSPKVHRRNKSFVSSIYTLYPNNSTTSIVLAEHAPSSAFDNSETLDALMRTGYVDGLFPQHHFVRNITRFIRFASASYGASFLRVMGIATSSRKEPLKEIDTDHHHEHHSFSNHTQLPPDTILLSSFVDPQGGTDATGQTGTGVPMVHFISLDHDSKAVVLTCRGTLGFEDVLTDMTCEYDEIIYREKAYIVHKGIHASAKRLLASRVLITIKAALEEFPDYGLVLCGHSLGGAVTALLAIMISEPSTGTAFTTSSLPYSPLQLLLPSSSNPGTAPEQQSHLPPGRPIHVYAYGPPATISPSLRLATRGLITTIVNNQDLVPYLSLGVLHDLQAVALAFKNDDSGAKGEVRKRVWEGLQGSFRDKWYSSPTSSGNQDEDDQWAYSALKALRVSMLSPKLVPPGEVWCVEAMPVLRRDAFLGERDLGRPATRSVLRYVRDVERRFGQVRFGGSMLLDHSPGRYEASLGALGRGVLDL